MLPRMPSYPTLQVCSRMAFGHITVVGGDLLEWFDVVFTPLIAHTLMIM